MGKLFELIADNALEKLDEYYTECHVCGRTDVDLYQYQGEYQPENGEIDEDIYAAFAECILTKKLSHISASEYIETVKDYLSNARISAEERLQLEEKLIEKYQKTPDVPVFLQYDDRPLCCDDITEFTGYPKNEEELFEKTKNSVYWERKEFDSNKYDFKKSGSPESLSDVATFKCSRCGRNFFTFQFT